MAEGSLLYGRVSRQGEWERERKEFFEGRGVRIEEMEEEKGRREILCLLKWKRRIERSRGKRDGRESWGRCITNMV